MGKTINHCQLLTNSDYGDITEVIGLADSDPQRSDSSDLE